MLTSFKRSIGRASPVSNAHQAQALIPELGKTRAMLVDVPVGGRHRGGCALKQGESERLEEEYDRQLGERLGQEEEEEEEGDRYYPTRRHGGRRQWFRGAVQAMWYLLLAAAAVSAVYHLLLAT